MSNIQTDAVYDAGEWVNPALPVDPFAAFHTRLDDDAPNWARQMNNNIFLMYNEIIGIREIHSKILAVVEEVKPEVTGVIASLQKNPMFKMLLGGK